MKSFKFIFVLLIVFLCINSYAQHIDTVILRKSICPANMAITTLDAYFDSNNQLVAFSNISGNNDADTMVIYDYLHDTILFKKPGTHWDYNLQFVNENRLLYMNLDDTIRSIMNFTSPIEKAIYIKPDYAIYLNDFAISGDKSLLVTLANTMDYKYQLTWFAYDVSSDTISVVDSVNINYLRKDMTIAISDDNMFIAVNGGYDTDSVIIVDISNKEVHVISTPVNSGTYSPVFFRQNNKLKLAVGGGYSNGSIEIIDVETLALERSVPAFEHYVYTLAVDSSGQFLACGGYDRELRIYDLKNLSFDTVFTAEAGCIEKIKFSTDNKYLLAGQGFGSVHARLDFYEIIYSALPTGVDKPAMNEIHLYPIPVGDRLMIDGSEGFTRFSVYSIKGELIKSEPLKDDEINFTGLPAGIYLIRLFSSGGEIFSRKIIRE